MEKRETIPTRIRVGLPYGEFESVKDATIVHNNPVDSHGLATFKQTS